MENENEAFFAKVSKMGSDRLIIHIPYEKADSFKSGDMVLVKRITTEAAEDV